MANVVIPTEKNIRAALLDRMERYARAVGVAPSSVSLAAIGDTTFYSKIKGGANFTVESYQRIFDFIDSHPDGFVRPKRKRKPKMNGSSSG